MAYSELLGVMLWDNLGFNNEGQRHIKVKIWTRDYFTRTSIDRLEIIV